MRTSTITSGDIIAVVRSRSRRTAIVEAQYRHAIETVHPEITAYERAQYETVTPDLPIDSTGRIKPNLTAQETAVFAAYTQRFSAIQKQHAVGVAFAREAQGFIPILARIVSLNGTPFDLTPPQFIPSQVNSAFEDWLDEEHEEFWQALQKAIVELDAPLTPIEQRPPETLTEAEQEDPLSVEVA